MFAKKSSAPAAQARDALQSALQDRPSDRTPQAKPNGSAGPAAVRPLSPPLTAGKRPGAPISQPKAAQPTPRQKDESMSNHSKPSVTPTFRSDFRNDGSRGDAPRRDFTSQGGRHDSDTARRLVVGKDISLNGEISTCDCLVVEGKVEASVREGRRIEIGETGLFKGTVEIEEADIAGQFEGDITTRGRLTIRSTGIVTGKVQYAELEIEAGGCINGTLSSLKPSEPKTHARPSTIKTAPSAERLQADLASETA